MMDKDLVIIASGGRTGTTFFGERLGEVIDDCFSVHEPDVLALEDPSLTLSRVRKLGLWNIVFGKMAGKSGLRPIGHRYLSGGLSEAEVIRLLRSQRERYYSSIDQSLVVESNGRFWMVAPILHKVWPGVKLIGVLRDPRDWIESWRRYMPHKHGVGGWIRWFPLGPLTPAEVGDTEWVERWDSLGPFGRLAWDWRMICRQLERAEREAPNVRIFRFEDLFGSEITAARNLVEFAANHESRQYAVRDLDGFTGTVRNASSGAKRDWRNWPADEIRLLDELCGESMRKHAYGLEPEWRDMVAAVRA